jgi:lactoylglutathione lyase
MVVFAHSALLVSDLKRSLAFYALLGFEERRRFEVREPDFRRALKLADVSTGVFLGLPGDADRLELLHTPGAAVDGAAGFHHTGLRVDDLDALLARLVDAGYAALSEPYVAPSGARICLVPDPDGYAVELIQPPA